MNKIEFKKLTATMIMLVDQQLGKFGFTGSGKLQHAFAPIDKIGFNQQG
jgi:hypothetical protein